jgi:hypothetical protein
MDLKQFISPLSSALSKSISEVISFNKYVICNVMHHYVVYSISRGPLMSVCKCFWVLMVELYVTMFPHLTLKLLSLDLLGSPFSRSLTLALGKNLCVVEKVYQNVLYVY